MIGIISLEDLIRAMERGNGHARVRSYMTADVMTVHSYDSVVTALETFARTHVGRFPVVDEAGQLVGMLTKGDITSGTLKALQRDYQAEEVRRYRVSHLFEDIVSDRTSLILRYHISRAILRMAARPPATSSALCCGWGECSAGAALRHCHIRSGDQPDHSHHPWRSDLGGN